MVHGLLCPSTQLDRTVENSLVLYQRSGMIAGFSLAQCLKLLSSFAMEPARLVVELMPIVDLLVGDDQRSILIVGLELMHFLIIPSHSAINPCP
jgi:hypothetical protein